MSSRKEKINSRLIESFSLRCFLVFNSEEFIAFDKDGIDAKLAGILGGSGGDDVAEQRGGRGR